MANSLTSNPIRLDTAGGTNLAQSFPVCVHTAILEVGSTGGTATIKDAAGSDILFEATNPTSNSSLVVPGLYLRLSNDGSTSPGWQLSAIPSGAVLSLYWK